MSNIPGPVRQFCTRLGHLVTEITRHTQGRGAWELSILVPQSLALDTKMIELVFRARPYKFDHVAIRRGWILLKWSCASMAELELGSVA